MSFNEISLEIRGSDRFFAHKPCRNARYKIGYILLDGLCLGCDSWFDKKAVKKMNVINALMRIVK